MTRRRISTTWAYVLGANHRLASGAVALLLGAGLAAAEAVPLIDAEKPAAGWSFDNGREFPGAKGGLVVDDAVEAPRRPALRLDGDFTGGGNYVQAGRALPGVAVDSLAFWLKAPEGLNQLTLRLVDGSGQCHQFNLRTEAHGRWQRIRFPVTAYFAKAGTSAAVEIVKRYEGWGGAKDGKWHDPPKALYILVGRTAFSEALQGSIWVSQVEIGTSEAGVAYAESFDGSDAPPAGWQASGPADAVTIVSDAPFEGSRALRLQRAETQLDEAVSVVGAAFTAAPGAWRLGGATRGRLHSPDNSFAVRLDVEALDGAGTVLERTTLVDETGGGRWKAFSKQVKFPCATAAARFAATFHKTHGSCDVDALTATPLQAEAEADIVERIVIGSAAVGNLFLPEDEVAFDLEVRTERPLPAEGRAAEVVVSDYWGAEQTGALRVALEDDGFAGERHRYAGRVALPKDALEIGKYYELHVALKPEGFAAAAEYSGFARLPVAESRRHPAEKIPFTIRNWDSRIPEYHRIASRIGLRQIGTWGDSGWERIRDLGDKWYGGPSGVSQVEREGWKDITEEKLRQNAIDFMTRHKDTESLACIVLGNEPNERQERIAEKIRAYQIAYEALKAVKPDVKIVTTSVPPLESFFEAGYHRYTDVYDFHVYETYENVRQAIRRYRELGRKHGAEKPIWCTELGLNSQGQTRHAVAQELVKKITAFFAEGGENVSWFTILYPDPDGKARGTSGDAHNTFDCQFSRYNPRLDAIMYYNMINGVAVKRFVDEVRHANGVQSYLFRDETGDCLHVLWKEGARVDCGVPLPGVEAARLIRIDGGEVAMKPAGGVITLGLSGEPVLLRYRQQEPAPLPRVDGSAEIILPLTIMSPGSIDLVGDLVLGD
ncbi:MAG: glycosyl hydrolase [Kiritimatiellae bacterium]|nr:glycosyl hydrolase [Kiritimatiellia bacterium]